MGELGVKVKNRNANKLVDVIIPTYNCEKYIGSAINSVLAQAQNIHNIHIIDDGSTDNTKKVIADLVASNEIIKYHYQENNGLSSARNTGIRFCESEYIAFLDADDIWLPNKLSSQLKKFDTTNYKHLGLVYGEYLDIDDEGKLIINYGGFRLHPEIKGDVSKQLLECNYATGSGSAVLVKRLCFDRVGLFDETLNACEDWDMWMRIAQKYDFDYVATPLVMLRRHRTSMQSNQSLMVDSRIKLAIKMESTNFSVSDTTKNELRRDALSLIISQPLNKKMYEPLFNLKTLGASTWPSIKSFIKDLIWSMYISFPSISHLASISFIRSSLIKPINRYFMKQQ